MLGWVSSLMLVWAFVACTALLVMYGLLQPWWRSWFGISMIIVVTALVQVLLRGVVTLWLGEHYPGRDWVLLLGRVEIAAGATIAVTGLGRELIRSWRATGRASLALGDADRVSGDL